MYLRQKKKPPKQEKDEKKGRINGAFNRAQIFQDSCGDCPENDGGLMISTEL